MSIWSELEDRSSGEKVRKEDQLEDIKKKIKIAAKRYVEDYIDAMFDSGSTVQQIQDQYEWAFMDDNSEYVVQRMDKEDQDKFWELDEEHNLCDYTYSVLKHLADEMVSALEDEGEEDEDEEAEYDEEAEKELKKRLDRAAKEFVEDYAEAMFQSGCTVDIMKHCYRVAFSNVDVECVIEDWVAGYYSDMFWDMAEEWKLFKYVYDALYHYGDEYFLSLKEDDKRVIVKKGEQDDPIDYSDLREVLKYQVENALKKPFPKPGDIPLVNDLYRRTLKIFGFVYEEINGDTELLKLIKEENSEGTIERLVEHISKYEGTNIPAPYKDIDDWWGDFNGTINYCVRYYKEDIESDRKWAEAHS